jgi:hypothetical protein
LKCTNQLEKKRYICKFISKVGWRGQPIKSNKKCINVIGMKREKKNKSEQ